MTEIAIIGSDIQEVIGSAIAIQLLTNGRYTSTPTPAPSTPPSFSAPALCFLVQKFQAGTHSMTIVIEKPPPSKEVPFGDVCVANLLFSTPEHRKY